MCLSHVFITDLWILEGIGITDPAEVKAKQKIEEETLNFFYETIKVNPEGRYQIRLLWREDCDEQMALSGLSSTSNRLVILKKLSDYQNVFLEWDKLEFIEEVSEDTAGNQSIHFLPHHAVIKEDSKTTKVRPVFDASAKDELGNFLNSCLEAGPNLIELIPKLLIKF